MKMIRFSFILLFSFFIQSAFAQVTSVSQAAKDNFAKQYPAAENAEWNNDVVNANVRFDLNGESMNAEYSNKGIWKNTVKEIEYEKLPPAVLDGFKKSKYADRTVADQKMIYYPGEVIHYRIKAEKNDIEKKYLFFDKTGRLVRETITL